MNKIFRDNLCVLLPSVASWSGEPWTTCAVSPRVMINYLEGVE